VISSQALKKAVVNALLLFLLGYFCIRSFEKLSQQDVTAGFFEGWSLLALAMIPVYMVFAIFSFKWIGQLFLGSTIKTLDATEQVGLSVVAKYLPGKFWGVAVRALLCERYSISASQSISFSLFEMVIACNAGLVLALGLWLSIEYPYYTPPILLLFLLASHRGYLLLAFLTTKLREGNRLRLLRKWNVISFERVGAIRYVVCNLLYFPTWIGTYFILNFYVNSLQIDLAQADRQRIVAYYITSMLAGFIALFSPGGIGVREGVFVVWAGELMGYPSATILAILMRLWSTVYDMAFGAVASSLYFVFDPKKNSATQ